MILNGIPFASLFVEPEYEPNPGKVDTTLIECGCCGKWHRESFTGDCRNDHERFPDPCVYTEKFGLSVSELTLISEEEQLLLD